MSHARFQKFQREKTRKAKAAAKRERRAARSEQTEAEGTSDDPNGTVTPDVDEQQVLAELAQLHDQFESGSVKFDDFEERKSELLARLDVQ